MNDSFSPFRPSARPGLVAGLLGLLAAVAVQGATPTEVLAKIDPATGVGSDTATEFSVSGVVSTRATLPSTSTGRTGFSKDQLTEIWTVPAPVAEKVP